MKEACSSQMPVTAQPKYMVPKLRIMESKIKDRVLG
jgi:hypothetical protein